MIFSPFLKGDMTWLVSLRGNYMFLMSSFSIVHKVKYIVYFNNHSLFVNKTNINF